MGQRPLERWCLPGPEAARLSVDRTSRVKCGTVRECLWERRGGRASGRPGLCAKSLQGTGMGAGGAQAGCGHLKHSEGGLGMSTRVRQGPLFTRARGCAFPFRAGPRSTRRQPGVLLERSDSLVAPGMSSQRRVRQ